MNDKNWTHHFINQTNFNGMGKIRLINLSSIRDHFIINIIIRIYVNSITYYSTLSVQFQFRWWNVSINLSSNGRKFQFNQLIVRANKKRKKKSMLFSLLKVLTFCRSPYNRSQWPQFLSIISSGHFAHIRSTLYHLHNI